MKLKGLMLMHLKLQASPQTLLFKLDCAGQCAFIGWPSGLCVSAVPQACDVTTEAMNQLSLQLSSDSLVCSLEGE